MKAYLEDPGIGFEIGIEGDWCETTCPSLVLRGATGLTNGTLVVCCFEWRCCCWFVEGWEFTSVLALAPFPTWSFMWEGGGEESGGGGGGPVGNEAMP